MLRHALPSLAPAFSGHRLPLVGLPTTPSATAVPVSSAASNTNAVNTPTVVATPAVPPHSSIHSHAAAAVAAHAHAMQLSGASSSSSNGHAPTVAPHHVGPHGAPLPFGVHMTPTRSHYQPSRATFSWGPAAKMKAQQQAAAAAAAAAGVTNTASSVVAPLNAERASASSSSSAGSITSSPAVISTSGGIVAPITAVTWANRVVHPTSTGAASHVHVHAQTHHHHQHGHHQQHHYRNQQHGHYHHNHNHHAHAAHASTPIRGMATVAVRNAVASSNAASITPPSPQLSSASSSASSTPTRSRSPSSRRSSISSNPGSGFPSADDTIIVEREDLPARMRADYIDEGRPLPPVERSRSPSNRMFDRQGAVDRRPTESDTVQTDERGYLPTKPGERKEMYIKNKSQLNELLEIIKPADVVAFDTEFISWPYYRNKLELIQLATDDIAAVIDCQFLLANLKPLMESLYTKEIILHAASQDLAILHDIAYSHQLPSLLPPRLFDTQVAASLVGLGPSIGYSALVEAVMETKVDKTQTLSAWDQRPMTCKQVEYALGDVRHLHQVRQRLLDRLTALNRLELYNNEMKRLADVKLYAPRDPNNAWQQIRRGSSKIKTSKDIAILRELASWRELTAAFENRSPNLILKDDILVAISLMEVDTIEQLTNMQGIRDAVIIKHAHAIFSAVQRGAAMEAKDIPAKPDAHTLPYNHPTAPGALYDLMAAWLSTVARQHYLPPDFLCSKEELRHLVSHDYNNPIIAASSPSLIVLQDWRLKHVGEDLLAIRRGETVRWDMATLSLKFVKRRSPCPPPPLPSLLLLPPQSDADKADDEPLPSAAASSSATAGAK